MVINLYEYKIIGAGSIGNHLAISALGWNVTICDIDDEVLSRQKL